MRSEQEASSTKTSGGETMTLVHGASATCVADVLNSFVASPTSKSSSESPEFSSTSPTRCVNNSLLEEHQIPVRRQLDVEAKMEELKFLDAPNRSHIQRDKSIGGNIRESRGTGNHKWNAKTGGNLWSKVKGGVDL